ncbi:MAG: hypothetical protein HC853_07605, partial [Anaerolineae bacterium]|nr:hypothetical protein [Anaerolineae bacterium]
QRLLVDWNDTGVAYNREQTLTSRIRGPSGARTQRRCAADRYAIWR